MPLFLGNSNKCSLDAYATLFSIVLKDHKLAEAITLSHESYKNVIREEASQQGFEKSNSEFRKGENYLYKPDHLVITNVINAETNSELLTVLEQMKFTHLDLKVTNLSGKGKDLTFFFKNCFAHNTSCQLLYYFVFVSVTICNVGYPVLVFILVGEPHFNKSACFYPAVLIKRAHPRLFSS